MDPGFRQEARTDGAKEKLRLSVRVFSVPADYIEK
jgi:hypothetical protein